MTAKVIIENKTFVLFLTGNAERLEFDELYDFELAKKEAENEGNGFRNWIEFEHNGETFHLSMDY